MHLSEILARETFLCTEFSTERLQLPGTCTIPVRVPYCRYWPSNQYGSPLYSPLILLTAYGGSWQPSWSKKSTFVGLQGRSQRSSIRRSITIVNQIAPTLVRPNPISKAGHRWHTIDGVGLQDCTVRYIDFDFGVVSEKAAGKWNWISRIAYHSIAFYCIASHHNHGGNSNQVILPISALQSESDSGARPVAVSHSSADFLRWFAIAIDFPFLRPQQQPEPGSCDAGRSPPARTISHEPQHGSFECGCQAHLWTQRVSRRWSRLKWNRMEIYIDTFIDSRRFEMLGWNSRERDWNWIELNTIVANWTNPLSLIFSSSFACCPIDLLEKQRYILK